MKQEKREFELSFSQERVTFIKTENFLDDNDIELGKAFKNIEKEMRMGFIRKVYGILSAQLALTTIMCIFSMTSKSWAEFQINNPSLMWFFLILSILSLIVLTCVPGFVRKVPSNYIVTGVFTIGEGYLVSLLCSVSEPRLVFMAASMTFGMTAALTVYACTTKTDFTVYNSALFLGVCCLFLLGTFLAFSDNTFLNTLYCSLGIFIYSIYLIVDTQMICDTGKYSFETDDYLLAAINLYIDVINLFLYILRILKR
jgi:FtsH-binding integral membrane protein